MSPTHLKNGGNPLATSVARFHVHYQTRRFLNKPKRLLSYIGDKDLSVIRKGIYTRPPCDDGDKDYDVFTGRSDDWLRVIPLNSMGISSTGQTLLQESIQAYVTCVLGAQARTRWTIVGGSVRAAQTRLQYTNLFSSMVNTSNPTNILTQMRMAIVTTKVRLDFALVPGLVLLPSDKRIQMSDVAGYNNVLKLSLEGVTRFGSNSDMNMTKVRSPKTVRVSKTVSKTGPKRWCKRTKEVVRHSPLLSTRSRSLPCAQRPLCSCYPDECVCDVAYALPIRVTTLLRDQQVRWRHLVRFVLQ